jgi:hypothetical protein
MVAEARSATMQAARPEEEPGEQNPFGDDAGCKA